MRSGCLEQQLVHLGLSNSVGMFKHHAIKANPGDTPTSSVREHDLVGWLAITLTMHALQVYESSALLVSVHRMTTDKHIAFADDPCDLHAIRRMHSS